jgi:hypothetical protein
MVEQDETRANSNLMDLFPDESVTDGWLHEP